jgi:hypothetical protein
MKRTPEKNLTEKPAGHTGSNQRGKPTKEEINGPISG